MACHVIILCVVLCCVLPYYWIRSAILIPRSAYSILLLLRVLLYCNFPPDSPHHLPPLHSPLTLSSHPLSSSFSTCSSSPLSTSIYACARTDCTYSGRKASATKQRRHGNSLKMKRNMLVLHPCHTMLLLFLLSSSISYYHFEFMSISDALQALICSLTSLPCLHTYRLSSLRLTWRCS